MRLVFFFLFLFCSQLYAQQKYIEVNVSDTVLAETDFFVYRINIALEENPEYDQARVSDAVNFAKKLEQQKKTEKHINDSLFLTLRHKGFAFLAPNLADSFNIVRSSYKQQSFVVVLHSFDSLLLLFQNIRSIRYLAGFLEMAKAGDESIYRRLLYKKLIEEAAAKAKYIASFSNQKISGVQSITENKPETIAGGWTAYPPLSSLGGNVIPGWHTGIRPGELVVETGTTIIKKYPISNALTVRFLVE